MALGDPQLTALCTGAPLDLVLQVTEVAGDRAYATTLWHKEKCICDLALIPGASYTIYGARLGGFLEGLPLLQCTTGSLLFRHSDVALQSFTSLVEVCAGIGGISLGFQAVGGVSVAALDRSSIACETLRLNGFRVQEGDISMREVRIALHQSCAGTRSLLAAGIPCQGYSIQGSRQGFLDARSQTLIPVLQASWHMQVAGVVLECVSEISDSIEAIDCLKSFAFNAGYQIAQVHLELAHQWASRRRRWWAVLLPACLPDFELRPWPAHAVPTTVGDVMPEVPLWDVDTEKQLLWDSAEQAAYANPAYGTEPRLLAASSQAPTALHSWGTALRPCPCKCRAQAFSKTSLLSRGLRGVGVPSQVLEGTRFPHPAEAGLLNSLPPVFKHLPDARAALCLVGQLAAPLQALWIAGQIQGWAAKIFKAEPCDLLRELQAFKAKLCEQRSDLWLLRSHMSGGDIHIRDQDSTRSVHCNEPVLAYQLLQRLRPFKQGFTGLLKVGNRTLPPFAVLHFQPAGPEYELCLRRKRAAKSDSLPALTSLEALPCAVDAAPAALAIVVDARGQCSDVQLWCGLANALVQAGKSAVQVIPPQAAMALLDFVQRGFQVTAGIWAAQAPTTMLVPFLHEGHWSLLALDMSSAGAIASLLDGVPGHSAHPARCLAQAFCSMLGFAFQGLQQKTIWTQTDQSSCGGIALAHAVAHLTGRVDDACLAWALSTLALLPADFSPLRGNGGLSSEQHAELCQLLISKGVPAEAAHERVKQAEAKLGAGPLAEALQQKNVWQALKTAASKPGLLYKWVQPAELKLYIERRAQEKFGTEVRNAKAKKQRTHARRGATAPTCIDPARLLLAAGSFQSKSGTPLGQLAFHEVLAQATGICFCTPQQASPFLEDPKHLSVDALALLITSEISVQEAGSADVTPLRFPAVYKPTQEAVLVSGSILQLGDEAVQLTPSDISEVEKLDTMVCRLSLYRDECKIPWEQIVEAPIRALMAASKELQVCKDKACPQQACPCFHAAVDETVDHLFLDIWSRSFSKTAGSRVKPSDSELFQAFVRIPASAVCHLLRAAIPGTYFEPRASDGTGPHGSWSVVWLPGHSAQQAAHALRTTEKAISLVRLGARFGLRTRDSDEQQVFEALRPQHQFLKVRVSLRYRLYPLPHGLQRHSLVQLLKQWKWNAKPLQPDRGDSHGCAWLVGTSEEPAAQTFAIESGYVLVTKIKDSSIARSSPAICASTRTKKMILLDDDPDTASSADPWSHGRDPWSKARIPDVSRPDTQMSQTARSKYEQLENGLKQDIKQDLETMIRKQIQDQAPPPGLSEHDKRVHALEVGMNELKHQNSKFESWFQSFGTRVNDQVSEMAELKKTVHEQQQVLAKVQTDVQTTVQTEVRSLQAEMTTQLSSQLAGQMEQIQALFADKKPRAS